MSSDFKIKIIGLTGQSGAGKSTVSKVFADKGVAVIDADTLAHVALKTEKCKESLRAVFGDGIFDESGEVVRKLLAKAAFSSEENTLKLNRCTHPVIAELTLSTFNELESKGERAVLFDAPTLLESGLHTLCSVIVSVIADKNLRAERIMKRDGLTLDEAMLRLNAQHDDRFYTDKSDYVIENNGSDEELLKKADELCEEILNG